MNMGQEVSKDVPNNIRNKFEDTRKELRSDSRNNKREYYTGKWLNHITRMEVAHSRRTLLNRRRRDIE
jgi:hypothetical protein